MHPSTKFALHRESVAVMNASSPLVQDNCRLSIWGREDNACRGYSEWYGHDEPKASRA